MGKIDTRKRNADKVLEAGASAIPGTFFAELKNNATRRGTGHCESKKTGSGHREKTFGKCNCGKKWIDHEKAFYTNPSREMTPLEVSTEEPEEKISAPAGGDNTDTKTNESS